MPDGNTSRFTSRRLQTAISDVQTHLNSLPGEHRVLTEAELRRYKEIDIVCGWSLEVQFPGKQIRLNLLIDNRFPRMPLGLHWPIRPLCSASLTLRTMGSYVSCLPRLLLTTLHQSKPSRRCCV